MGRFLQLASIVAVALGGSVVSSGAVNQIVGIDSPAGGTAFVKHFAVSAGSTVVGVRIKNNDDTTVFPRIDVLSGAPSNLMEGTLIATTTSVTATSAHRIEIVFSGTHFDTPGDVLVAIIWPPSSGVEGVGRGAGIGATTVEDASGSYMASRESDPLQPLLVDLAIELLYESPGKARASQDSHALEVPRFQSFLRIPSPRARGEGISIAYGLDRRGSVDIDVFDVNGRRVRQLRTGIASSGAHTGTWDGSNQAGNALPAGVYMVRMVTQRESFTRKVVIAP